MITCKNETNQCNRESIYYKELSIAFSYINKFEDLEGNNK